MIRKVILVCFAFLFANSSLEPAQAGVPSNQYVFFEFATGIQAPQMPEYSLQIPLSAMLGYRNRANAHWAFGGFFQSSAQTIQVINTEARILTQFFGAQMSYYFNEGEFNGGFNTGMKVAFMHRMTDTLSSGTVIESVDRTAFGFAPRLGYEVVWDSGVSVGGEVNYFISTSEQLKGPFHLLGLLKFWF